MRRLTLLAVTCVALFGCADDPVSVDWSQEPFVIHSPGKVVDGLERAYRDRDYIMFEKLLANDPDRNAEFLFLLSEPTETGDDQWGYATEERIHRRMFRPDDPAPGDLPVPRDVWLVSVDITLTPLGSFNKRDDLYSQDSGKDRKLDPKAWRAVGASYQTNVFFDMLGETKYQVNGQAEFVVIEDLTKSGGQEGRFLLFIWRDIPVYEGVQKPDKRAAIEDTSWTSIKSLFL